jgi:hypothetical protein
LNKDARDADGKEEEGEDDLAEMRDEIVVLGREEHEALPSGRALLRSTGLYSPAFAMLRRDFTEPLRGTVSAHAGDDPARGSVRDGVHSRRPPFASVSFRRFSLSDA